MFKYLVNMPCKQVVENAGMHETAKRLYEAALVLSKGAATKPGEVAAFFGVSQQVLKNWEGRGISQQGMVAACEQHPAIQMPWLSLGEGEAPSLTGVTNTPTSPPAQASNVELVAGGEASVEALVDALASTLNAFETLAQREVVAERLRALAFYPDSAKARAEVVQVLSCPPSATAGQSGAPTHQAPGITPALQQLFQRKAVAQTADFATPPPAVAPPDEPPSRALQNKTGQK